MITFIDTYHSKPSLFTCTNPCKGVTVGVTINNELGKKLHFRKEAYAIFTAIIKSCCWEKAQSASKQGASMLDTRRG